MAVTTFPILEKLCPLVDLQIHQVAMKNFHYHVSSIFPYNLLISVLDAKPGADDFFTNGVTDEKTRLRPGHAYLLPCHLPVRFERTPEVTVVTIRFNLTFFYGLDIFDGARVIEEIPAQTFTTFLKNTLCSDQDIGQIKTAVALKAEVLRLCLSRWPEPLKELTPKVWRYEAAFLYVRKYGDASLTVGKLAEVCGVRQDVFSRSFSRDVGVSPKQYIADVLVKKISAYLLTSSLTLKDIAHELKFSSEYYLSRFFKKHTRLSPRDYKKLFFG